MDIFTKYEKDFEGNTNNYVLCILFSRNIIFEILDFSSLNIQHESIQCVKPQQRL